METEIKTAQYLNFNKRMNVQNSLLLQKEGSQTLFKNIDKIYTASAVYLYFNKAKDFQGKEQASSLEIPQTRNNSYLCIH